MLSSKHWEESGVINEEQCPLSASCCPNRACPLWPLFPCTVGRYCATVAQGLWPCLPLPVCRTQMRGSGVGFKVKPVLGTLPTIFWMDVHHVHCEKTAWQSCDLLLPSWVDTGRQHAACTGSHSSTCRWFHFTNSCSSDNFFLEYLYNFLKL